MSQHILYAVVQHSRGRLDHIPTPQIKVRVSEPLDWDTAIERWYEVDDRRREIEASGSTILNTTAARIPVWFFAVRAADDPDWPADAPLCRVRTECLGHEIRFV